MSPLTPSEALQRLVDGNDRFVAGATVQRPPTPERLAQLAQGQRPFATILGCSDSRVPAEIVFDQGLGDLFIVRVAGHVLGVEVLGSLVFALEQLATPLFVVLGHGGCGAVQAALKLRTAGASEQGSLGQLLATIVPALRDVDPGGPFEEQVQRAVEANVRWVVRQLRAAAPARGALADGRLRVAGAVYDLATGRVRFLSDEP